MITIFSIPKPFKDNIAIIQRNAIKSWTLLEPRCEVILFGDDAGTAETAAELGVKHVPDIARNEYGTPLLSDVFDKAQRIAANGLVCYVNCDIIFKGDLTKAAGRAASLKKRFVMVGRRWNIDIVRPLDFSAGWEERLEARVHRDGELFTHDGIDYFVFTKGVLGDMPPFAIGRPAWDNWTIYRARSLRVPVIDATRAIMCIHQNHNYSHMSDIANRFGNGPEAQRNFSLCGGWGHFYTLYDADWALDGDRLRPAFLNRFRQPSLKLKRALISMGKR
jgi:hypothetical protein